MTRHELKQALEFPVRTVAILEGHAKLPKCEPVKASVRRGSNQRFVSRALEGRAQALELSSYVGEAEKPGGEQPEAVIDPRDARARRVDRVVESSPASGEPSPADTPLSVENALGALDRSDGRGEAMVVLKLFPSRISLEAYRALVREKCL